MSTTDHKTARTDAAVRPLAVAYGQGPQPENYISNGYERDVMRNVDGTAFHPGKLSRPEVIETLSNFVDWGNRLDRIKKVLIYGRLDAELLPVAVKDDLSRDADFMGIPPQIVHAIIGMATEASELVEAVLKTLADGEPFDTVNFVEETGDILWYGQLGMKTVGSTLDGAAWTNTRKLAIRYPDKFTQDRAINRDTQAERGVLETSSLPPLSDEAGRLVKSIVDGGDDRDESFASGCDLDA
jgi:hypothetical protein